METKVDGRSLPRKSLRQIFDSKWIPEPNSGCWLWLGATDGRKGYGRVNIAKSNKSHRQAHRLGYELYKCPIPDRLVLDHKCRNPSCVNPDHLEPVTQLENMRRGEYKKGLALGGMASGEVQKAKTHCPNGHEYTPENTLKRERGWRGCKACHREKEAFRRMSRGNSNV